MMAHGFIHDVGGEWFATVVQHRNQEVARDTRLQRQQGPQLRVTILFHNEHRLMSVDERLHCCGERESSNAHVVADDATCLQAIDSLSHGRVAPTQ